MLASDHASHHLVTTMPKVELHAHLGGSVRLATLDELMLKNNLAGLHFTATSADISTVEPEKRMEQAFAVFDAIRKVTGNLAAVRRIAEETVLDYAAESCRYLELRSTPRALDGATEEAYVETVLQGIAAGNHQLPPEKRVHCELLLSFDRSKPEAAATTERLVRSFFQRGVAGADLSGNCYKNEWRDFVPFFDRLRRDAVPATLHAGEKQDAAELKAMLDWLPERIGHLVFSDDRADSFIRDHRIPIEVCLTSNLFTSVGCVADHHVRAWLDHPISINTDDRGVFNTTLTKEYSLLLSEGGVSERAVFDIVRSSVAQAFVGSEERREVAKHFDSFEKSYFAAQRDA
ncbi:Adenosine deaminase-like protein [Diplonema papillatum]|nr:Adenosine deaminase-like protein [Diplonema papillatum]